VALKDLCLKQNEEVISVKGESLSIEEVVSVARYGALVALSPEGTGNVLKARQLVDRLVEEKNTVYGITTGFGKFSNVVIDQKETEKLQENLIISHAVGVGDPIPEEVVRAAMLLRINTLAKGYSGVRLEVVETLINMLNSRVHPVIPEKGSLGASGDLAPLAHMVLVMIGRGKAYYQGQLLPGGEAMEKAGIPFLRLKAKEGLALINGTQIMTAYGALAVYDALVLARSADIIAAMTCEAQEAIISAFDPKIQMLRPHPGQVQVAANMVRLLENSENIKYAKHGRVQDAYTLRCIPQVHGATRDAIDYARKVIETEINSVTDNPIIFPDHEEVISGGNFHGQPVALAMDFLGIAISELANISERRIERLVNPALSGLPAFLVNNGGLNSGFMIYQYAAASLVSENKVLAHPASVDSIPSSANQEDHVSMGAIGARKAREIIKNVRNVLAIESICAAQGMDLRGRKPSKGTGAALNAIRKAISMWTSDRETGDDIDKAAGLIANNLIVEEVKKVVLDFL